MASRNVNKVILIGNLTKDPELRYTPQGNAVVNFTVATNRTWTVDGEEREDVEFHNVVAWNKLAEICDQLLGKGSKVYVEGRLQTRDWVGDDGKKRYKTEVNIDEMIVLDSRNAGASDNNRAYSEDDNVGAADGSGDVAIDDDDEVDIDELLDDIEKEVDGGEDKEE